MSNRTACLGDVAEFINGVAFKPEDWSDFGSPIIRIQNLSDRNKPFNRTTRNVDKKYHVKQGDLLVSWSATLGIFEWSSQEVGLLNQHIFLVLPDERKVSKSYLRHILGRALDNMKAHLHGATMQHVNRGAFLGTQIYLPSGEEQRRIAAILGQAEALRTKRRQALAKLDTLTQSLFLEMFGSGWQPRPFGEVVESFRYGTSEKSCNEVYPALRIPNVLRGSIDLQELKTVPVGLDEFERLKLIEGDVLFVRTNGNIENVGRCAVFSPDHVTRAGYDSDRFIYASYLIRARLYTDICEPMYVRDYLAGASGRRQLLRVCKTSAGQFNINIEGLSSISIPVPPIGLQKRYCDATLRIEVRRQQLRESLAHFDTLFASLQHRAFSGEL